MSLFNRLFKKDEKRDDGNNNNSSVQAQDKIQIKTSFTTFTYINYPNERHMMLISE